MNRLFVLLFLSFFGQKLLAQNPESFLSNTKFPFSQWSQEMLESANTAKDASFLTNDEKLVVWYLNLVRMQPALFAKTFVAWYLSEHKGENDSYAKSLLKDLDKAKKVPALAVDNTLYLSAAKHAKAFGNQGKVGHGDFDKRMKPNMQVFGAVAENCDYGSDTPLEMVVHLLIDSNVSSLGHRKTILSGDYQYVGVSIAPHKSYGNSCVQDFGGSKKAK